MSFTVCQLYFNLKTTLSGLLKKVGENKMRIKISSVCLFQRLFCSSCCSKLYPTWSGAYDCEQVDSGGKEETPLAEHQLITVWLGMLCFIQGRQHQKQNKTPLLENSNENSLLNLRRPIWPESFSTHPVCEWAKAIFRRDVCLSQFHSSVDLSVLHSLPRTFSSPHLHACISK